MTGKADENDRQQIIKKHKYGDINQELCATAYFVGSHFLDPGKKYELFQIKHINFETTMLR